MANMNVPPVRGGGAPQGSSGDTPNPSFDLAEIMSAASKMTGFNSTQLQQFLANIKSYMTDLANSTGSQYPPIINQRIQDLCNQYDSFCANPGQVAYGDFNNFLSDVGFLAGELSA